MKKIFISIWPIPLLVAAAAMVLFRGPYSASNLDIVPDSTEYALAAHRLATAGEYKILVDGRWLPPRYPPWFSVFFLAPAYLALGSEIGNAIFPITIFGIAGVVIAFFLGRKIGGHWGGTMAALAVLALPTYRQSGLYVMTDVPSAVLMLWTCLLYLRIRAEISFRPADFLRPGFLITVAALLRPVCAAAIIPFLSCAIAPSRWAVRSLNLSFLAIPLALAGAASVSYNMFIFGSPFRNGYHFWVSVPYDYPHLAFSLSFVMLNFTVLWKTNVILLISVTVVMWGIDRWYIRSIKDGLSCSRQVSWIGEFILLGCGPMVLFHLFYFYPEERFYLPVLTLLAATIGGVTGAWLRRRSHTLLLGMLAIALCWAAFMHISEFRPAPYRRLAVDEILRYTPRNSLIITGIEPAYLEYMVARESQRRIVPISRRVEYAGKTITPKKISNPEPPPQGWFDHRCAGLLNGGAQEAVRFVAAEQLDAISEQSALGTRIFIELLYVFPEDQPILTELEKRFRVIPLTQTLFELHQRN